MTDTDSARLEAVVSGRVTGVFYRRFVLTEASNLGLRGFTRNLRDGRVEVVAEGERSKLEALIERLRVGPPNALVREVEVEWAECRNEFDGFHIEYS